MNIQCDNCDTKFYLDEKRLKEEGSKVRCSVCKNVFWAYPPEQASVEQEASVFSDQEKVADTEAGDLKTDIDKILEELMEEPEGFKEEEESSEDILDRFEGAIRNDIPSFDNSLQEDDKPSEESAEELVDFTEIDREPKHFMGLKQYPKRKSRLPLLLVILLLLVAGVVSARFFAPELIPDWLSVLRPSEKHGEISLRGVVHYFVNSEKSGNLFVIKGTAINKYTMKRRFIRIKASILNDSGQEIRTKQAYAGNTFGDLEIKAMSIEEIDKAMEDRFGMGRSNFNVAPGGTIPFMIVFANLPEDLGDLAIEAASSFPAK